MYTCYNINKYVHVYTNQRVNTFMLFFYMVSCSNLNL